MNQLTILAEAFGVTLSPQRQQIYIRHLADVPQKTLELVFHRAIRECEFFPTVAKLLEMAAPPREQLQEAGATRAWDEVWNYLSRWGVSGDRHSVYGPAPRLDQRTQYAIRSVGGLNRINRASDQEYGFIQRTFEAAWQSYDVTKHFSLCDLVGVLDGAGQKLLKDGN